MPADGQPNFLIIGVQKAGTTFLAQKLSEHPSVFFCKPKEPFFFSHKAVTPEDFALYRHEYFYGATDFARVGEGSTNYFSNKHAIDHIERFLGTDIKVVLCLRHPLERALSHFLHDFRRGRLPAQLAITDERFKSYLARSIYAQRLKPWTKRFPNFQIQFFDDLVADGVGFYRQGERFLDLPPMEVADSMVNEGLRVGWRGDVLTLTTPAKDGGAHPEFSRSDIEYLQTLFAEDIDRVEQMTGRNLSSWKSLPNFSVLNDKASDVREIVA